MDRHPCRVGESKQNEAAERRAYLDIQVDGILFVSSSSQLFKWDAIMRVYTSSKNPPCTSPLLYTSGSLVSAAIRHEPAGTLQRNRPMRYSSGSAEGIILPVSRAQDIAGCVWGGCKCASRILSRNRHHLVWLSNMVVWRLLLQGQALDQC